MNITYDKVFRFDVWYDEPREIRKFATFHEAYEAAEDGAHIELVVETESRPPIKCMCGKYSEANTRSGQARCEYCGCL